MNKSLNISIVLYHNREEQIKKAIESVLNTDLNITLYLVDNSSTDSLRELERIDKRIVYIFNNSNLGFGKAHNIALKQPIEKNIPPSPCFKSRCIF
jgi:Predicted glycosyltransferases